MLQKPVSFLHRFCSKRRNSHDGSSPKDFWKFSEGWPLNDCWITLALKEILDRQKQLAKILVVWSIPWDCSILKLGLWAGVGVGGAGSPHTPSPMKAWSWVAVGWLMFLLIWCLDIYLSSDALWQSKMPWPFAASGISFSHFAFSSWVDILASKLEGWHSVWPLCLGCSVICFFRGWLSSLLSGCDTWFKTSLENLGRHWECDLDNRTESKWQVAGFGHTCKYVYIFIYIHIYLNKHIILN